LDQMRVNSFEFLVLICNPLMLSFFPVITYGGKGAIMQGIHAKTL
jgi:hypothetical protein